MASVDLKPENRSSDSKTDVDVGSTLQLDASVKEECVTTEEAADEAEIEIEYPHGLHLFLIMVAVLLAILLVSLDQVSNVNVSIYLQ